MRVTAFRKRLSWNPVKGAERYYVYRSAQRTGKYTFVKSVTSASATDDTIIGEGRYYYKVRAVGGNDFSELSQSIEQKVTYLMPVSKNVVTIATHRDAETAVLILGGNLTTVD